MPGLQPKIVVVPTDLSDLSRRAIARAADLVAQPEDLHVVHVLPELSPVDPANLWDSVDDASRTKHAAEAIRQQLGPKLAGASFDIRFGDAGAQICELAEELDADLIVISSHGRTGLARLALGSVTERVVRLARVPVLVLPD